MAEVRIPLTTKMSKQLKKAREDSKITQATLARGAKVPRARIKRIECLELSTIDRGEYTRLCKKLGVAVTLPATKTKAPAKSKVKLPTKPVKAAKSRKPKKTSRLTRKQVLARLEKAGLADLTVRELLSLAS